jgi:hypothetical protein
LDRIRLATAAPVVVEHVKPRSAFAHDPPIEQQDSDRQVRAAVALMKRYCYRSSGASADLATCVPLGIPGTVA